MNGKDDELAEHFDRQLAATLFSVAMFSSPRAAAQFAAQSLARNLYLSVDSAREFEKHLWRSRCGRLARIQAG